MPEGVLIPYDGALPVERVQINALEDYQNAVGGYIQAVYLDHETGANLVVYVNENGKLEGLPLNQRASRFLLGTIFAEDYIVGNALVLEADLTTGNDMDCPALGLEAAND